MDKELTSYCIEAHELSASGVPHIQGFCHLIKPLTERQMHQIMPKAALFVTKSTDYQNYLYCAKGEQTHEEWESMKETGPNWGLRADFQEYGTRPKAPGPSHKKKPADSTYVEALAAPTTQEAMEIIKKRKARDYCLYGEAIERNIKRLRTAPPVSNSHFKPEDFLEPLKWSQKQSMLFCGPSNIGKTQFALAHFKNPFFVDDLDNLAKFTTEFDGIVFDDMSFKHIPPTAVIHLLDWDCARSIRIRYKLAYIPANTRKIFTHNTQNPFYNDDIDEEQKVAIERRFQRITFHSDIRKPKAVVGPDEDRHPEDGDVLMGPDPTPVDDYTIDMNQVD